MSSRESVVNSYSMGIFKASNWKKEGAGLLVAAKALRQQWLSNREAVVKVITERSPRSSEVFTKDTALARSSMLLLGYSVEMFLKGGVVKLYSYGPEEVVKRLMRKLGHDYEGMAKRLRIELEPDQFKQLNGLSQSVVDDARYPATPSWIKISSNRPIKSPNTTTDSLTSSASLDWSSGYAISFRRLTRIAQTLPVPSTTGQTGDTLLHDGVVICLLPSYLDMKIS